MLSLLVLVGLNAAVPPACAPATTATLAVDPSANGEFRTLEEALAAARALPEPRNVTITIAAPAAGTAATALRLQRGVSLTARDSCLRILGTDTGSGNGGGNGGGSSPASDHLRMDSAVPLSAISRVADDDPRVHPAARGRIFRVDLRAMSNVTHAQPWPDTFTQGDPATRTLGVFWQGRRLQFARSPKADEEIDPPAGCSKGCENKGSCTGGIPMRAALAGTSQGHARGDRNKSAFALYPSEAPRVAGWASAVPHGLYLLGNWRVDFVVSGARVESLAVDPANNATAAAAVVHLAANVPNGIGWKYNSSDAGCGCEPFFALNALELVTEPLEYALDAVDRALYIFLPLLPGPGSAGWPQLGELTVTDVAEPMLTIGSGARAITVESLRLGFSYGGGVVVAAGATTAVKRPLLAPKPPGVRGGPRVSKAADTPAKPQAKPGSPEVLSPASRARQQVVTAQQGNDSVGSGGGTWYIGRNGKPLPLTSSEHRARDDAAGASEMHTDDVEDDVDAGTSMDTEAAAAATVAPDMQAAAPDWAAAQAHGGAFAPLDGGVGTFEHDAAWRRGLHDPDSEIGRAHV